MYIIYNLGQSFKGRFTEKATTNSSLVQIMLVEAHNSVSKVERYYTPVCCVYELFLKSFPKISKEERLALLVKCVNNTVGLDGLVPTLLVFSTYLRILSSKRLLVSTSERVKAIKKGIEEVRKCYVVHKVYKAL